MLLHGEERVEIFRPFKAQTKYVTIGKVSDIQDKVKGMLLTFEMTTYEVDENKKKIPVASQYISLFIRKLGGFGYKGKGGTPIPKKPTR